MLRAGNISKRPLLRFVIAGVFLEYSHYYKFKTACNPAIDIGPAVPSINLSCEFQNQMPVQQQYSAMEPSLYTAPPEVRGLTCLDKEAFAQTVVVPALCVTK